MYYVLSILGSHLLEFKRTHKINDHSTGISVVIDSSSSLALDLTSFQFRERETASLVESSAFSRASVPVHLQWSF
jgi:hypothetical protein